jgi:hypothetical protein
MSKMMKSLISLKLFLSLLIPGISFSQNPQQMDQEFEKMVQRMRQMQEKMMDSFMSDQFEDQLMDDFLNDPFFNKERMLDRIQGKHSDGLVAHRWKPEEKGKTLILTPKDPKAKLDIEVKEGAVKISGVQKVKEVREFQGQKSESISTSTVHYKIGLESQLDQKNYKIKQVGEEIHLYFPYKGAAAIKTKNARPSQKPTKRERPIKQDPLPDDVI